MVGGVAEYLSLATGFQFLLLVIAACYVLALLTRPAPQGDGRALAAMAAVD